MKDTETRVALLEQSIGHINETLLRIEKRFDAVDKRFDELNNRLWSNFFWMIGGFVGIMGLIARTQHWI